MPKLYLSISNLILSLDFPDLIKFSERFEPFKIDTYSDSNCNYSIKFLQSADLLTMNGNCIFKTNEYHIYEYKNKYYKYFIDQMDNDKPYCISTFDTTTNEINIIYLLNKKKYFNEIDNSFFHIGWENLLIHKQRMILHSSCVNTKYGGILFTGNSGIGKSTQADLWIKHKNAYLINGDRTILERNENRWLAHGSPYAGSSKCYKNECCLVKAIVILKQSKQNSIRRLKGIEAFKRVFSCITVNSWDHYFVSNASDLTIQLINDIQIYELSCTPDINAVKKLEEELEVKLNEY